MKEFTLFVADVINFLHDLINDVTRQLGWNLTDKDLHFWVFGIVGILSFIVVHAIFKVLIRYSLTSISFIYTFTVLLVIVFAIEIQQKLTGRGSMELNDALISLWGFILFFVAYLAIKGIIALIKKAFIKFRQKHRDS